MHRDNSSFGVRNRTIFTFSKLAGLDVTIRSTQFSWRGKISEFQADPCYGSINNNA